MTARPAQPPQSMIDTVTGLFNGYGAEDTAAKGGHAIETIRDHVQALRRNRMLPQIVKDAQRAWKKGRRKCNA